MHACMQGDFYIKLLYIHAYRGVLHKGLVCTYVHACGGVYIKDTLGPQFML